MTSHADVAVVGAGAAGLATAIFTARHHPGTTVVAFDGALTLGAKILVSGGGRCNVTNIVVEAADFQGGSRHVVRRVLSAFPARTAAAFFREIGVPLHAEPGGKLFPDSNKARTVLAALVAEAERRGARLLAAHRVVGIAPEGDVFRVHTSGGAWLARRVVLATGGLSLPKTGSDGGGYALAEALGHSLVPRTPALVPLVLDGTFHADLSGVSHDVIVTLRVEGKKAVHVSGPLLWTHFGVSGPAALDASRFWHAARGEGSPVIVSLNLIPGQTFDSLESWLLGTARRAPRTLVSTALATRLPSRLAEAILAAVDVPRSTAAGRLEREPRRRLVRALTEWPLPVRDSRGYNYAEVTAGGVPLTEVDPATLESRKCPGLHLVGEILDVDGRIGGFNFQWAWSSAWVAATALAASASGSIRASRQ
ncbi:MAG: NAD(P)/FAD-dependent oxidoreductase [Vicinamibacteria bacterium]